jgi:DNA invertase Pin-like site-specific DNA recombinase
VSAVPIRAAAYVRMSTEHQQYSTENQGDVLREYAKKRGMEIVRTFADSGKSGLRIDGRDALKELIAQVETKRADFTAILVYDVSRWGRFQDADESAYYEYICRRAGISVVYCAEQFENDGSPVSTIVKGVKRAMAGEYSRELSAKVFKGQCRLIELGFRQGGAAGFGLRRMLVDQSGALKGELRIGEQKSLQTDRVILVPGPEEEIVLVQRIYGYFVGDGRREAEIAHLINGEGWRNAVGEPWTRGTIRQVLTNEKYVGNNVYNRSSFKLKKMRVRNPPDMWVRRNGAFTPIVAPDVFDRARQILLQRHRRMSEEELIVALQALLAREGRLSALLIDDAEDMPASTAYRHRFGSLLKAYERIGYEPERDYGFLEINRALREVHARIVDDVVQSLERAGGRVERDPVRNLLTINGEFTATVVLSRCLPSEHGIPRWRIAVDPTEADITVAVRMDVTNGAALDYYLFPAIDVMPPMLHLREQNAVYVDAYRFEMLEFFFGMAERARVEVAA